MQPWVTRTSSDTHDADGCHIAVQYAFSDNVNRQSGIGRLSFILVDWSNLRAVQLNAIRPRGKACQSEHSSSLRARSLLRVERGEACDKANSFRVDGKGEMTLMRVCCQASDSLHSLLVADTGQHRRYIRVLAGVGGCCCTSYVCRDTVDT
eukprot:5868458-Pyramimonas_sp.AAC.2